MGHMDSSGLMPVLHSIKDTQIHTDYAASREIFSLISELLTMRLSDDEMALLADIVICYLKQSEPSVAEALLAMVMAKARLPLRVAFFSSTSVR